MISPHRAREAEIGELLARVEAAAGPDRELDSSIALLCGWTHEVNHAEDYECWRNPDGKACYLPRYTASIDAALALVERVLPGWMWRVATCSVSDDAWVCPDFNHPTHGAEFQARFNDAFDGRDPAEVIIEATDVDRRPSGQPALAVLQSLLLAMTILRTLSTIRSTHP